MIAAIERLLILRKDAIKSNKYAKARDIEDELARFNVSIKDTPHGVRWYIS